MKQLYTMAAIAATLLTTGADAQSPKAASPLRAALVRSTVKEQLPQGRAALMAAKGIQRLPHHAGAGAARGGVANDDCATAQAIALVAPEDCATGATIGDNGAASNSALQPACDDPSSAGFQDVWYTFNSGTYVLANIRLTPADPDVQDWGLVVYDACGGNEVACALQPTGPVAVPLNPGTDYYVRVYSNLDWGVGGPFTLCISPATPVDVPANDQCTGAVNQNLSIGGTVTFTGDNTGATNTGDGLNQAAVWEMFTTLQCTNLELAYCGTSPAFGNAFLNLYRGCPYTASIPRVSYDTTSCGDGNLTIFFEGVPAGTYYYPVMLDQNFAIGPYMITVTATTCAGGSAPANDNCAGATLLTPAITCGPVAGTTAGATGSMEPVLCNGSGSPNAKDVWYSFIATATEHTVRVEGMGDFDAVLEFFSGNCSNLASLACEDSSYPDTGPATEVMVLAGLTVGETYYVRVYDWGHGSTTGHNFNICVTGPAEALANDDCAGAILLTPATTCNSVAGTTAGAMQSMDPILCNGATSPNANDVWYSFTATTSNDSILVEGIDDFDAVIELFSGDCGSLTSLACEDGNYPQDGVPATERMFIPDLTVGSVYYIRVYDYAHGSEDHNFNICVKSDVGSGISDVAAPAFTYYPNPTQGDITISGAGLNGKVDFELTDMTGRVVYAYEATMGANQPVTLPLNGKLAQGTYTLRLITTTGSSSRPVMIK